MLDDETPLGSALRDEARLAALWRTGLLDTPPEEVFDRLTRLTRRMLDAPVALVSLVEADRQFFKSALGLPEPWATRRETPLSHSFCQHVVATGAPLRWRTRATTPGLRQPRRPRARGRGLPRHAARHRRRPGARLALRHRHAAADWTAEDAPRCATWPRSP
jgi:hypothetical protein